MAIEPPYPADLEAKGWSLDLDYERIEQSDTWAIASADQRPWLLMLWMIAWRQSPVASLPNNDKLIAARIGMPLEQFAAWRDANPAIRVTNRTPGSALRAFPISCDNARGTAVRQRQDHQTSAG